MILPIVLLILGYVAGRAFEYWVVRRMKAIAGRSESKLDDLLVDSLRGLTTIWFCLAAAFAATATSRIPSEVALLLNKVLTVGFILSGTVFVARLAAGYATIYAARISGVLPASTIFTNLTRLLIYITGLLIILQTLGISITPILTALGVGGLAVALAMQDTLSNLFSGLHIIGSGQVKPGDFVKLESGNEGYVVDVAWRNTTIRELSNNMIIVPNARLASSQVCNFDQPGKDLAVLVQVGVGYGSDLDHVERVTMEVGREVMLSVAGGVRTFEPFIRYHTFADFSINFTVILRGTEFVDQYLIKHEFIKRLHKRYAMEHIEIPFPVRTVHVENDFAASKNGGR